MDGPVGLGKTSQFLIPAMIDLAEHVQPIDNIRRSLWAFIRESENSSVATLLGVLQDDVFTPEMVADPKGPVKVRGSHPTNIVISYDMPDKTKLEITIECHGFNNPAAEGRLRSRNFLGILIPEIQTIPREIVQVARQRTGRWRPTTTRIEKYINGRRYALSGPRYLKLVLADANIPKRDHWMYNDIYDLGSTDDTPFLLLTPPPPIKPVEINKIKNPAVLDKYPTSKFQRKEVVWLPNPDIYFMTKHYESDEVDDITGEAILDEYGNPKKEAWSGYHYWFNELAQSESVINRHIIGKPDQIGGDESVYHSFNKQEHCKQRDLIPGVKIRIGYDPGKYGCFVFFQYRPDGTIHVFKTFFFEPSDALTSRRQIEDFVAPYHKKLIEQGYEVLVTPDPAAANDSSLGESPVAILWENGFDIDYCLVPNQDTDSRMDMLGYFLDNELVTIDPSCDELITALVGGYKFKVTNSGLVSDTIDKNQYSHPAEAFQYPVVNLYFEEIEANKNAKDNSGGWGGVHKVKKKPRK